MSEIKLPELPEPFDTITCLNGAAMYPNDPIEDVPVYTADQLREFAKQAAELERERCIALCEAERSEFMEQAARNDGRQSDMAFGSVNTAERLLSAIRGTK